MGDTVADLVQHAHLVEVAGHRLVRPANSEALLHLGKEGLTGTHRGEWRLAMPRAQTTGGAGDPPRPSTQSPSPKA